MSQFRSPSTNIFRKSLRSWQADYKAQQAEQPAEPAHAEATETTPPAPQRVKRMVSRKHKARRQAARQGAN